MTTQRSLLAGMTDYRGVPYEDIVEHFVEWRDFAARLREVAGTLRNRLEAMESTGPVAEGLDFLAYSDDLFRRLEYDCGRLAEELPSGVHERHLDTLAQLVSKVADADDACINFQKSLHLFLVRNEEPEATLLDVYSKTRDGVIGFLDIGNTIPRLRVFLGAPPPVVHNDFPGKTPFWHRIQNFIEREDQVRGLVWKVVVPILMLLLAFLALF